MTTPMSEDGGPLREWAPLTNLLQQIPIKLQNGLFTQDISFTCIDALSEFLAVGTNCGLIYWFDRQTSHVQRLRCENTNLNITCLKVISTVDYMVAAGTDQGIVTVFQIPKDLPASLPDSLKPKQKKQVERYNITGLHRSAVTTVEWSKNGMKLFSGDQEGSVVLTEIDFYMHLSKSSELLNEKYAVVQLSYQQGFLLVSTLYRTILVHGNQNNKVSQVGQKERKTLGKLGAVFGCRHGHVQEPLVYASRPGLRIWQADKNGTVQKTLIFKEAVRCASTEVVLLNPAPESVRKNRGEPTFGVLLPFCDDLLVTYSDQIIYVVNPTTIAITSVVSDLRRVIDVACTKDEIFVLEGERNIIRIAYHPDASCTEPEEPRDPLASLAEMSKPVTAGILGLTSKLKDNSIVPAIPFYKINPSNIMQAMGGSPSGGAIYANDIVHAEEATEVSPIVSIYLDTELISDSNVKPNVNENSSNDRREIFKKISQQDFEDIVFTPERRSKKSGVKNNGKPKNTGNNEDSSMVVEKTMMNDVEEKTTYASLLTLSIDDDSILRTERNLESLQKDVENKEKLLADVLNFDLSEFMTNSQIHSSNAAANNSLNSITYLNCEVPTNNRIEEVKIDESNESQQTEDDSADEDESYRVELKKLQELGECSKRLLQRKASSEIGAMRNNIIGNPHQARTTDIDPQELERHFNILSKEFVTSASSINTGYEEIEDWVVVPSIP
ncbi:WD repeat-containing protein CG11141 [Venturia canescens]|uniref:WD repeat-containing protein CG11141 n=1 Tax=Venturia canescens TaxID=32260 RepID=UPI001C9C64EF|nr:WD repeat-containing protein CG11141 [Venturia canescens]